MLKNRPNPRLSLAKSCAMDAENVVGTNIYTGEFVRIPVGTEVELVQKIFDDGCEFNVIKHAGSKYYVPSRMCIPA